MGDIRVLEELLLLLGHTSELTGGRVEADVQEMGTEGRKEKE